MQINANDEWVQGNMQIWANNCNTFIRVLFKRATAPALEYGEDNNNQNIIIQQFDNLYLYYPDYRKTSILSL